MCCLHRSIADSPKIDHSVTQLPMSYKKYTMSHADVSRPNLGEGVDCHQGALKAHRCVRKRKKQLACLFLLLSKVVVEWKKSRKKVIAEIFRMGLWAQERTEHVYFWN